MKKFLSIVLTIAMVLATASFTAIAGKSDPLNTFDFNQQTAEGITTSTSTAGYFAQSYEANIGGKTDAADYAYKVLASQHGSQSGSQNYTVTVPIAENSAEIVTTEFDFYTNLTAKATAKEKQVPSILFYASDTNVIWMKPTAVQSVLESWKALSIPYFNGNWSKIALVVNKTQKTFSMYWNNSLICSKVSLGSSYADKSYIKLAFSYWYDAPGEDCFFALDNICSYAGEYAVPSVGLQTPSAAGYAVDDTNSTITVPAFTTLADINANIISAEDCSYTVKDINGNAVTDSARMLTGTMKAAVVNTGAGLSKTYSIIVSNQVLSDDFESWSLASLDFSDATIGEKLTGTDTAWCDWNTSKTGGAALENEAGRGKVLKLYTDDTAVASITSGDSISLMNYLYSSSYVSLIPQKGDVWVVSYDIKSRNLTGRAGLLADLGNQMYIGNFTSAKTLGDAASTFGKAYDDTWYTVTEVINTQSGEWNAYVNGIPAGSGTVSDTYTPTQIRFSLDRVAGQAMNVWFDNFMMYDFANAQDFSVDAFLTNITSNDADIHIGKGSMKNIITLSNDKTVADVKAALACATGATVAVSGNDTDKADNNTQITVTSANQKAVASYKISIESGVVDFAFKEIDSSVGSYISATCEYDRSEKPTMLVALYNGDMLALVSPAEEDLSSLNIDGYLSNGVTVQEGIEWDKVKAFVFNSLEGLVPLSGSLELTK